MHTLCSCETFDISVHKIISKFDQLFSYLINQKMILSHSFNLESFFDAKIWQTMAAGSNYPSFHSYQSIFNSNL